MVLDRTNLLITQQTAIYDINIKCLAGPGLLAKECAQRNYEKLLKADSLKFAD